jgi:uncharacterized protein YjiS (DUF1127 family)
MKANVARQILIPVPRLAAVGQIILAKLRLYRSRLRERACLAQMNERDLRDIGMSRMDQIMLVEKPFWRE